MGFEPTTSSMPSRRAPNCATAPPEAQRKFYHKRERGNRFYSEGGPTGGFLKVVATKTRAASAEVGEEGAGSAGVRVRPRRTTAAIGAGGLRVGDARNGRRFGDAALKLRRSI